MESIVEHVARSLRAVGIEKDYTERIGKMMERGIIGKCMSPKAAYTAFLLHMGKESQMFLNILKNKYVFDLTFTTGKRDISLHGDRFEYVHTEVRDDGLFVGVKLRENIYDELKNVSVPDYLIPYKLLAMETGMGITGLRFCQPIFVFKDQKPVQHAYAEFVEHLKSLSLPLSIVSDDLLYEHTSITPLYECYVYLEESSQWPRDRDAIDCAKTAFYCQLYSKSKYRVMIDEKFCIFRYNEFYFKVKILIKKDFNMRYKVLMGLHSVMGREGRNFHRKVKMIKDILGGIGFYPLILDDFLVDCIALIVGRDIVGDAKCIENFLNFDFDIASSSIDLDTMNTDASRDPRSRGLRVLWKDAAYVVPVPSVELIEELKLKLSSIRQSSPSFSEDFELSTMARPDFNDYSFVLSNTAIDGSFKEIVGSMGSSFDLGTPEYKDFVGAKLSRESMSYYSPNNGVLMVRVKKPHDADLIANMFINETSFCYIRFNK